MEVVLHQHLILGVLQECHVDAKAHLGFSKTLLQTRDNFYFKCMQEVIMEYVINLSLLHWNLPSNQVLILHLKPIPTEELGQMWGLDLVGPFLKSCHIATEVILEVDYGRQYCLAKAISKVMSRHIIRFLEDHVVWWLGMPVWVAKDQSSIFMSREFQEILSSKKIEHCPTMTYHPQCNRFV